MGEQNSFGDVHVGDYVSSLGRAGTGQPIVRGIIESIADGRAFVRTAEGKLKARSVSNLRRVSTATEDTGEDSSSAAPIFRDFGASIDPYGRGALTARTRSLLASGVRMGTINGDTRQVHGPDSNPFYLRTAFADLSPDEHPRARLEELRAALRAESISYGELVELQGLAAYIEPSDVELLEAASVPEFPDDEPTDSESSESVETLSGEFGDVFITENAVSILAGGEQLYAWAKRPGAVWPCSTLIDLDSLSCTFDSGGLVDLTHSPESSEGLYVPEIAGDELSAWSSDVLRDVLPKDHPAWFVTVGQFENGRA